MWKRKLGAFILCFALVTGLYTPLAQGQETNTSEINLLVANPFNDVKENDWFYNYVMDVFGKALFNGTSGSNFAPFEGMTRAMFVTVLSRVAQIDESLYGTGIFSDVESESWYTGAVNWAAEKKIVEGYGDNKFGPYDLVTREHMSTFIARFSDVKGINLSVVGDVTDSFEDSLEIADWAEASVEKLRQKGIIQGDEHGFFNPENILARSEAAALFVRFMKSAGITLETLPLRGIKIGVDAGHQAKGDSSKEAVAPGSSVMKAKVTTGTQGTTTKIYEYELNLAVALKLESKLQALGAEVIMVRRTHDVNISNQQRAIMMNEAGVDLCIRIHANGDTNSSVSGALMMLPSGTYTTSIQAESEYAGKIIFEEYLSSTGAKDKGYIYTADLTGFNWSTVPVCLIELGFMTNPTEDKLLTTDEYREKCAEGLAQGILKWHQSI